MKKLVIAASLALSGLAMSAANGYHITGTAAGVEEGDTVFLCEMQGFFSMVPLDTTTVKNGKFEFSGDFDGAATRFILPIHNGKNTAMADFLLENADIISRFLMTLRCALSSRQKVLPTSCKQNTMP